MPARDHAASRSDRASVPPARLPDADLGPDIELPAIEIAIIARREGRPLVGEVVDARPQREIRKFILDRDRMPRVARDVRSEEHTSELQSLMRISYAVFCLKKKN